MGYIPNNKAEVRYVDNNILLRHISDSLKNGHKAVLRIKGESMYPFLRNTRDLVVLKTPCANELKPGAIFLFQWEGRYIFHRLIKIKNGEYWMRGDHNRTYELVIAEDIIGIVEQVRRNGGESIINCRSLRWRVCSYCWMKSFPVHRWLLGLLNLYAGLYRNKKVK